MWLSGPFLRNREMEGRFPQFFAMGVPGLCHYTESLSQPQGLELPPFLVFSLDNCCQVAPKCNRYLGSWALGVRLRAGCTGSPRSLHGPDAMATLHLTLWIFNVHYNVFSRFYYISEKLDCNCLLSSHDTWIVHFVSCLSSLVSVTWH